MDPLSILNIVFRPIYIRQNANDTTGEHSSVFLKTLSDQNSYLNEYTADFTRRFASLLGYEFSKFAPGTALQILGWKERTDSSFNLKNYFTAYDLERINLYAKGIVDYHLIIDLLPMLVKLVATGKIKVTGLRIVSILYSIVSFILFALCHLVYNIKKPCK